MDCMRPTHTGKGNLLYSIHWSKCFLSPRNTRIDSPRIIYDQLSGHPTAPVKSTHKPNHYKSLIWWSSSQLTSTQEAQRRSLEVREWSPRWQDSLNSQRERISFPEVCSDFKRQLGTAEACRVGDVSFFIWSVRFPKPIPTSRHA